LEVIGTADNPVFSGDESTGANRDIGELEGLDDLLGFMGPDVDVAYTVSLAMSSQTTQTYRCRG
jgi:hypothetical protein